MNTRMKEWVLALIEALIILLILYLLLWPVKIQGNSMEPNFSENDHIFICRAMTTGGFYEKGNVVVFKYPFDGENKRLIKRVIATDGDHVQISNGIVFVNDRPLSEQYTQGVTYDNINMTIPKNTIFVLGDNREHSTDSRDFGVIPKEQLEGKLLFRFFPFSKSQFNVKKNDPTSFF